MRRLRDHLSGDAIRLLLVRIARFVHPKLRLRSRHLLLAAIFAFNGEIGASRAARALALQQEIAARREPGGVAGSCVCVCRHLDLHL